MSMSDDGKPHFTYYDAARMLSYVWDGGSMMEVAYGGYGEPVIARIPASRYMQAAQSPAEALHEFEAHIRAEGNPFNVDLEVYPR